ncbi:MAG TPA: GerMN domain-containing protein [Vicinamibacteria bacterium]|nr:GerMN domain-containing protein [Vicinamibacteria bacterium]
MNTKNILLAAGVAVVLIGIAVWGTMWILRQPLPQGAADAEAPVPPGFGDPPPTLASEAPTAEAPANDEPVAAGRIQVKLYVLARSGRELATETEEILYSASLQQQAKEVVRLLLRRSGAIPRGVSLRELFITSQGVAYLDLSQELVSNHPGGSSAEELTVFSLSQTLIANFPAVKTVRILVEGREIQTIAGHLDLTIPYGRAPSYLQPPSERAENQNEAS